MRSAKSLWAAVAVTVLLPLAFAKDVCVEDCFCKLVGQVDDCCCDFGTVNTTNMDVMPVLGELLKKPFFAFYKTNVFKACPFWKDDGMCSMQSCAIKECKPDELPFLFRHSKHLDTDCEAPFQDPLVTSISDKFSHEMDVLDESEASETFWDMCDSDEVDDPTEALHPAWYNLTANPERFTGYIGNSAAQVWRHIYAENCFVPDVEGTPDTMDRFSHQNIETMSIEKRTFFRIISGLHTSITTHVCYEYFDSATGTWGPNPEMFYKRFAPEMTNGEGPWRLRNLFFTYLFVVRALEKAEPYWARYQFNTGDVAVDQSVQQLVSTVVKKAQNINMAFDETTMFDGDSMSAQELKVEFRERFSNITRLMDCVGCTKCRLWGKLQIQGLAAAIKILFTNPPPTCEDNVCQAENHGVSRQLGIIRLRRNEVVALVHTLGHLGESIEQMGRLRQLTAKLSAPSSTFVSPFKMAHPFGGK